GRRGGGAVGGGRGRPARAWARRRPAAAGGGEGKRTPPVPAPRQRHASSCTPFGEVAGAAAGAMCGESTRERTSATTAMAIAAVRTGIIARFTVRTQSAGRRGAARDTSRTIPAPTPGGLAPRFQASAR